MDASQNININIKTEIKKSNEKHQKSQSCPTRSYFPNPKPITSKLNEQTNIPSFRFEYVFIDNKQFPRNKFVSFFRFLPTSNTSNSTLNIIRIRVTIVRNKNQIKNMDKSCRHIDRRN